MERFVVCMLALSATPALAQSPETELGSDQVNSDQTGAATEPGIEIIIPESCVRPAFGGEIPNGATASEREMLAVQAQVREFTLGMDEYIACVNEGFRLEGDYTTRQYSELLNQTADAARAEVDEVATAFTASLSAFRTANGANALRRTPPARVTVD